MQTICDATDAVAAANQRFLSYNSSTRRRIRHADEAEPITWQEDHAPTEPVMVNVQTKVELAGGLISRRVIKQERCRQRKTEAQLLNALDVDQITALEAIYEGWCCAHGRVSTGVSQYGERMDRGHDMAESRAARRIRLEQQYHAWRRLCSDDGVEVNPNLQIIIYGHSVNAVNKARRAARGRGSSTWAKENLLAGLDIYVDHFIRRSTRCG